MRVTAEYGQLMIGMTPHHVPYRFANCLGGEMGDPMVVRDFTLVPTGIAERGDMGEQEDVAVRGQNNAELTLDNFCRLVGQGH